MTGPVVAPGAHRDALVAQQAAFLALTRTAPPDAGVPGCPGWTVRDVVAHLTGVHRWAAALSRTAPGAPVPPDEDPSPADDPAAAYAAAARALLAALDEDPDRPCTTLAGAGRAGDWYRRQAHETLVHTWDLADAAGAPRTGPADRVADAVEEVLDTLLPRQVRLGRTAAVEVGVELLGSRRWRLGTGPVVATVAGPDTELLRLLWGRTTSTGTALVVAGDRGRAAQVLAAALTP
ncbi:maleylpyruvate isomerase family mycothiol-dependent enzyme [Kineococcus sp. TBRC 1896]|uniref:Maleylpyruvate isomerase family mycothiol-dependent enzyme n=1 Tax=Kineococcus mangrovi TaxID=1660183 RepID=A0ABV4I0P0_9ACTN